MELALPLLFGGVCVALFGLATAVALLGAGRERRRRERLHPWARHHHWTVTPTPAVDWGARLPGGNRAGVSLALSTTVDGRLVSVAEYAYSETHTSSGPDGVGGSTTTTSTQTHHFVVTVVRLSRSYPPIAVEPRGALSKLGRTLFGAAGATTGHANFDRQFRVTTTDRVLARRLITPALIGEHLAGAVPPWSLYGHDLLAYRPGRIDNPNHIPGIVAPLLRVARLFAE